MKKYKLECYELEKLLKLIGGKKTLLMKGIDYSINGVCATWCLEDIKGDGVSYNLFRKEMTYWRGYNPNPNNPNPNGKYFWDISKITEADVTIPNDCLEMEFDSFNLDDQGLYEWLEKEFRTFIRDKKINDILN